MTLRLKRLWQKDEGYFSELTSVTDKHYFYCLEHAYPILPKLPNGSYTCIRGKHMLHNMTETFETFEVTGVKGHTGILFHWGNFAFDSNGCILLGQEMVKPSTESRWMLTQSRAAFAQFMLLLSGQDSFTLIVEEGTIPNITVGGFHA